MEFAGFSGRSLFLGLNPEHGIHFPTAGEAFAFRLGVEFHQLPVVVDAKIGNRVKAHGGNTVRAVRPGGSAAAERCAVLPSFPP